MTIEIRTLRESDRPRWQELYYSYLDFYESQPIESSTDILWNRLTKQEPEIQALVATIDETIVGFVHFHFQRSSWTHTSHCYLEDLFVEPSYRSKGVATALIAAVKSAAKDNSCSELFWITKQTNETARKLYDKVATLSDFVRYEIMLED